MGPDQAPQMSTVPPTPPIWKLIESGGDVQAIVQQLHIDFNAPDRDLERVFLAIDGLIRKGQEGHDALNALAQGTDELGVLLKKAQRGIAEGGTLENLLGIRRFERKTSDQGEKLMRRAYEYAKSRGYTYMSYDKCMKGRASLRERLLGVPPHLDGRIEKQVFVESWTFGSDEPAYMELLGPREILRLRSIKNPSFLLLGSFGVYSAREFKAFARKINPEIKSLVIDIDEKSIKKLASDPSNKDTLVQADARRLPFGDATQDHIYTNKLLRFLGDNDAQVSDIRSSVEALAKESLRVLKPGGSLVILETTGDASEPLEAASQRAQSVLRLIVNSGFVMEGAYSTNFSFIVRGDIGSPTIDNNGFPQYGRSLLYEDQPFQSISARFVKPK